MSVDSTLDGRESNESRQQRRPSMMAIPALHTIPEEREEDIQFGEDIERLFN